MATNTTKLALVKPDGTDLVDIAVLNANADKIDTAAGAFICTSTTRPTSPWNGQVIFETNTLNQYVWLSSTSTWARLGSTPAGTVVSVASNTVPTGWLLCDGTSYQTTTYPDLAAALNYAFGGSGSNFNVPDLRGRVPVGKNAGTFATLGATGGAETVTLTEAQMPSHSHGGATISAGAHAHNIALGGTQLAYTQTTATAGANLGGLQSGSNGLQAASAGDHAHGISASGSSQAHPNLQPYAVLNYIIKP